MSDLIGAFVAPGLSPATAVLLVAFSFLTSMTTAAISLGGGAMMIAVMSLVWPAAVAVPVHGAVQLGSNVGRTLHRLRHVQWHLVGWFVLGSALGSIAGGQVVAALPDHIFRGLIGLFLIYAAWGPKPRDGANSPIATVAAGAATAGLGMIVGASGPLVAAALRRLADRRQLVGTHAFLMSAQHIFKGVVFAALGFGFAPFVSLILAMIVSGFAGTLTGGLLLDRLPERAFRIVFRVVMTLIAFDLIRRALFGG